MKNLLLTTLLTSFLLAVSTLHAAEGNAKPILEAYVKVATDLAKDDLEAAKKDAANLAVVADETKHADLAKSASAVAESDSIDKAREAFKVLSKLVIPLAKDAEGYYVMTCPMAKDADWVQNDPQVANPYFGSAMLTCGKVKTDE